jgi:FMN phosphatase YigB (HAD superfamily)
MNGNAPMVFLFDLDDTLLDDLAAKQYYMPRLYDACCPHVRRDREDFYSAWKAAVPKYHSLYASGQMTFEERLAMERDYVDSTLGRMASP